MFQSLMPILLFNSHTSAMAVVFISLLQNEKICSERSVWPSTNSEYDVNSRIWTHFYPGLKLSLPHNPISYLRMCPRL